MNTIKHVVVKVKRVYISNNIWCVDVDANSWGSIQENTLVFATRERAEKVKVGYEFEA